MGRPLFHVCAVTECDAVSVSADEGVFFDLQELIFCSSKKKTNSTKLWACCKEHKLAALSFVLKDMPYQSKVEILVES